MQFKYIHSWWYYCSTFMVMVPSLINAGGDEDFVCPITCQVMRDPVVASGEAEMIKTIL